MGLLDTFMVDWEKSKSEKLRKIISDELKQHKPKETFVFLFSRMPTNFKPNNSLCDCCCDWKPCFQNKNELEMI